MQKIDYNKKLKYIKFNKQNPINFNKPKSVIIIGSSFVGKTTIRNILEEILSDNYCFPKRVVTRNQRPGDDLSENIFAENLEDLYQKVGLNIVWQRDLGESVEYYGFEEVLKNKIPVYSANNALLRSRNKLTQEPKDFFEEALVIMVFAPNEQRINRNFARQGDYLESKQKEKEIRLSDDALSMESYAHVIIDNSDGINKEIQEKELANFFS